MNNRSYENEFEFGFDQFSKVESNEINSKFSLLTPYRISQSHSTQFQFFFVKIVVVMKVIKWLGAFIRK